MAQVRNISGEARSVPELGGFGGALVDDGETVTVPDDRHAAFVSQDDVWESVTAPTGEVTDPTIAPAPLDDDLGWHAAELDADPTNDDDGDQGDGLDVDPNADLADSDQGDELETRVGDLEQRVDDLDQHGAGGDAGQEGGN